ncbi:MAG: formylglycine-generating enzyme family protein [Planctomycetota bacterium]|jgi:formylglycine-generating enzyme required for sulfatase activity
MESPKTALHVSLLLLVGTLLAGSGCRGVGKETRRQKALSVPGTRERAAALEAYLKDHPGEAAAVHALEKTRKFRAAFAKMGKPFEALLDAPVTEKDRHGNPVVLRKGSETDPDSGWPLELYVVHRVEGSPPFVMAFVLAPKGKFTMGGEGYFEAGPKHAVEFQRPFYLGKYLVTQEQWEAVMGVNPSYFKTSGPHAPVDNVSWDDSKEFVTKLNARILGVKPSEVDASKAPFAFRLPSEAEWEYACRAGTETKYAPGDTEEDLSTAGWFCNNSDCKTHRVGELKPNAWFLYDMHGNVWEWCEDPWHGSYLEAPSDGSVWKQNGYEDLRLLRGGAWYVMFRGCASRYRCAIARSDRHYSVGLRLVLQIGDR